MAVLPLRVATVCVCEIVPMRCSVRAELVVAPGQVLVGDVEGVGRIIAAADGGVDRGIKGICRAGGFVGEGGEWW